MDGGCRWANRIGLKIKVSELLARPINALSLDPLGLFSKGLEVLKSWLCRPLTEETDHEGRSNGRGVVTLPDLL